MSGGPGHINEGTLVTPRALRRPKRFDLRLLEVGFPGLAALRMSPTAAELLSGSKAVGAVGQWYPLNNTSSR